MNFKDPLVFVLIGFIFIAILTILTMINFWAGIIIMSIVGIPIGIMLDKISNK